MNFNQVQNNQFNNINMINHQQAVMGNAQHHQYYQQQHQQWIAHQQPGSSQNQQDLWRHEDVMTEIEKRNFEIHQLQMGNQRLFEQNRNFMQAIRNRDAHILNLEQRLRDLQNANAMLHRQQPLVPAVNNSSPLENSDTPGTVLSSPQVSNHVEDPQQEVIVVGHLRVQDPLMETNENDEEEGKDEEEEEVEDIQPPRGGFESLEEGIEFWRRKYGSTEKKFLPHRQLQCYLFNEKNKGPLPHSVTNAPSARTFYQNQNKAPRRGQVKIKNLNLAQLSNGEAEKWKKDWAAMRKRQKMQIMDGLIILENKKKVDLTRVKTEPIN